MNLDYLRTYLEIIRLGSFSEVAKKLSLSQPAVSFQIQKLERDLGVRLIDRSRKAIVMTEAGKRLLPFAELVEAERVHLLQDLDQMREEVTGKIVIAASTIPGEVLLPPILGGFKAVYPATRVALEISDSLTVISRVQDGTYEVGFCGIAPEGRELEYFKVAEDKIVLIVFPEHPFAKREKVSLPELEGEPLIFRERTSGTQRTVNSALAEAGLEIDEWSPHLVLGTHQALVAAVEARLGIAFVSNLSIRKSLALDLVKEVAIEGVSPSRNFYCIYRKERLVSRLFQEFIAFVQARVS